MKKVKATTWRQDLRVWWGVFTRGKRKLSGCKNKENRAYYYEFDRGVNNFEVCSCENINAIWHPGDRIRLCIASSICKPFIQEMQTWEAYEISRALGAAYRKVEPKLEDREKVNV